MVDGADIDGALVDLVDIGAADNVGNDGKNDFVFRVILRGLAEEVFEDRNLRQVREFRSAIWSADLP